ncbi:MAG: hypothetical protein LBT75_05180 [Bacilli bacterium]|jgi:hypothetical protein|nr:hypothetical protein [Bacilli bacterium]
MKKYSTVFCLCIALTFLLCCNIDAKSEIVFKNNNINLKAFGNKAKIEGNYADTFESLDEKSKDIIRTERNIEMQLSDQAAENELNNSPLSEGELKESKKTLSDGTEIIYSMYDVDVDNAAPKQEAQFIMKPEIGLNNTVIDNTLMLELRKH